MLLISSFVKYTVNNLVIIFNIDIKVLHKFLLNIIYIITSLTATQYTFYLDILSTKQYALSLITPNHWPPPSSDHASSTSLATPTCHYFSRSCKDLDAAPLSISFCDLDQCLTACVAYNSRWLTKDFVQCYAEQLHKLLLHVVCIQLVLKPIFA